MAFPNSLMSDSDEKQSDPKTCQEAGLDKQGCTMTCCEGPIVLSFSRVTIVWAHALAFFKVGDGQLQ